MEGKYVGIDVSKDSLDMAVHNGAGQWHFSNNEAGIKRAIELLGKIDTALVVFEATGGLELPLWSALTEAGMRPAPVNPRQVRDFAKAAGRLAKTDSIDARVIAHYGYAMRPQSRSFPNSQMLKELMARRADLMGMSVAEQNRLRSARDRTVRCGIQAHIKWLQQEIAEIDKDLRSTIEASPEWSEKDDLLQSTPGVGPALSATLLAEFPELGTLSRQQAAALAGVAPLNHDSGKMRGKRSVWGGRGRVRATLYMATLVATRHNPVIRAFYQQLLARGKVKKAALTACMRKLIVILNAMLKHRVPWAYSPC